MKFVEIHLEDESRFLVNIDSIYLIGAGDGTDANWATVLYYSEYVGGFMEGGGKATEKAFITKKQFEEIKNTLTIKS